MISAVIAPFRRIFKNRELILELSRRESVDIYKGQPLGAVWSIIKPLVLILLYIFLFGVVFKSNVGFSETMPLSYSSYILSGMVPWLCIQTCLTTGSTSVINNAAIVKQVIFPIEVFPIKSLGSALIMEGVYLAGTLAYNLISSSKILWTYALLPIAILLQIIFLLGINYILSSLTVYLKDIKDFVQLFCLLGVYIMPVVYLPDAVPSIFRPFLYINPFSHYIWMFQDTLYFGNINHPYSWIVCTILSFVTFFAGDRLFQKLKVSFGSVI